MIKKMIFFFGPYTMTESGETLFQSAMRGNSDFKKKRSNGARRRQGISLDGNNADTKRSLAELSARGSSMNVAKIAAMRHNSKRSILLGK